MYELIEKLCKEKGISPTKLCVQITGSRGNLPTWKKGNINPVSLVKIADFFEVSTDYLLGRVEIPNLCKTSHNINAVNVKNSNIDNSESKSEDFDSMTKQFIKMFEEMSFENKIKVANYAIELENKE